MNISFGLILLMVATFLGKSLQLSYSYCWLQIQIKWLLKEIATNAVILTATTKEKLGRHVVTTIRTKFVSALTQTMTVTERLLKVVRINTQQKIFATALFTN
ncbi:unnamed protein product [Tenebrio molitor]|nr:unnamed protein product [Tenebrio molitor]